MPELPEVETTRKGISPHIVNQRVESIVVRQPQLRWLTPDEIHKLEGKIIKSVTRRAKYLLINTDTDSAIIHLGMSGSLRITTIDSPVSKHDHIDFQFTNKVILRLRDPRRFGAVLWSQDPLQHRLICNLGPEPLSTDFHEKHLYQLSRNKRCNIKQFIMDSHIVVGVGNIYASESLFIAGINPKTQAGRVSLKRYKKLTTTIIEVLEKSIEQGGTTLRDFVNADGETGYFQVSLNVYGKANQPCPKCTAPIRKITQSQRSTFYCSHCQT